MVYLPTFTIFYHLKTPIHVGKYTSPMDGMGLAFGLFSADIKFMFQGGYPRLSSFLAATCKERTVWCLRDPGSSKEIHIFHIKEKKIHIKEKKKGFCITTVDG